MKLIKDNLRSAGNRLKKKVKREKWENTWPSRADAKLLKQTSVTMKSSFRSTRNGKQMWDSDFIILESSAELYAVATTCLED